MRPEGSPFEVDAKAWVALNRLLDEALDLEDEERDAWLAALPEEHRGLAPRLRSLLAHAGAGAAHIGTLPKLEDTTPESSWSSASGGQPGERVGPYQLTALLAEGGMGSVWLADRADGALRRQVALKLPKNLRARPDLVERIARERDILASLDHPHIARLYDAGSTSDGQPYLALEHVVGRPIDVYVADKKLGVEERLRLFLQVAAAVAFAHSHLVIHRDLKPSNILVTDDGQARLLDFGIAKLLEEGEALDTELTHLSGRPLTLAYASPEQIRGEPLGVASDIYSLGVVLYEILTSSRPHGVRNESRRALEDAILYDDPLRPSDVASDPRLSRTMRGDLDTVVLRALKKTPGERYPTVDAFIDDVERYLEGRPVRARPDSATYRLSKFASRNRLAVATAVALLIAIVGGAGAALWQARVALEEKRRAEEVTAFISSIFRDADPYEGSGTVPTVVDLLKQAQNKIARRLNDHPALRVEMLNLVGASLLNLQENEAAAAIVGPTVAEAISSLGAEDPRTLQARTHLAQVYRFRGRTEDMRAELETLVPALERRGPSEELVTALKLVAHLGIDEGNYAAAESAAREASEMARTVLGPRHPETAATTLVLALAYLYGGKPAPAAEAGQKAYRLALELHDGNEKHPRVIDARIIYGRALGENGETARAIDEIATATDDAAEIFGASSMMVGFYTQNLVSFLLEDGQVERAVATSDRAFTVLSQYAEPESFSYAATLGMQGRSLLEARRGSEALPLLDETYATFGRVLGPDHARSVSARAYRALALAHTGRLDEARSELGAAVEASRNTSAAPAVLDALGQVLRLSGSPEEALRALEAALASVVEGPKADRDRMNLMAELGAIQVELGRHREATETLERSLALFDALQTHPSPRRADAMLALGRARLGLGNRNEAVALFEAADSFWTGFEADPRWAGEAALWRGIAYRQSGRELEAREALARAESLLRLSPIASDRKLLRLGREGS